MANFCIRPELAQKLKEAAKAGEITIEKLYGMSTPERRALFSKFVDEETAQGVNTGFEKAMVSEQKNAIGKWVNSTFSSAEKKKAEYKDIITKINELDKQGLLTPENEKAFMQDLVAEKLGGTISVHEAKTIAGHAAELQKHAENKSPFNTPTIEYFMAKKKMENYIESLTPTSNLRVFTSTVGRGAMLLSVKSPLLNIISNSIHAFLTTAERRIEQRRFNGFNAGYANQFKKYAAKVYAKTGYDLSRFQSFEGGIKALGEEYAHSQGKGVIRAVGRFYEDIAFKRLQGAPDAAFARFHFADSANLSSSVLALKEGLRGKEAKKRALEILTDAFSLAPTTKEGVFVRAQAEADALYATYTNKSIASDTALAFRKVMNTASGDFRIGDIVDPFVKTPANVLQAGLDFSGVTLTTKVATGIVKTLNEFAHLRSFDKNNFANTQKYFVRAGLGLTFAYAISSLVKPEDFLGQYPTTEKERQLLSLRNGTTNAIRVGDSWVSLDYLGPLGAPLLGFLYAKKYGDKDTLAMMSQYGVGAISTLPNFPGWNTLAQSYDYVDRIIKNHEGIDKVGSDAGKEALTSITSRIIPGIMSDLAKMTDPNQRQTDKTDVLSGVQAQIPFLREGLPIKDTVFGDKQKTEPWLSTLLFGARVKNAKDSQLINELTTLNQADALPSITDVQKTSSRAKDLKLQIGDSKFNEAMEYFGKNLKENFIDAIDSYDYEDLKPQEKMNMLNKVKEDTFNDMLDEYGYEKKEDE